MLGLWHDDDSCVGRANPRFFFFSSGHQVIAAPCRKRDRLDRQGINRKTGVHLSVGGARVWGGVCLRQLAVHIGH